MEMVHMRITDAAVIKDGEKELIDSIIGDLDWAAIENIFKEKHRLDIQDDVELAGASIVSSQNGGVEFDATVGGAASLTVDALGGVVTFGGTVVLRLMS